MNSIEKIINQRDMFRARVELIRMLTELSDDALKYVWRPISYAYYWTDAHDHSAITEDDINRIHLVGVVANGSLQVVDYLNSCRLSLFQELDEWKKKHTEQADGK